MLISENISFRYRKNKKQTLSDLNVKTDDGDLTAVMGESGSGKSTFLAVMAGILKPDQGKVLFNGEDIYSLDDRKLSDIHLRHISYVPQSNIMLKHLTVIENIICAFKETENEGTLKERAFALMDRLGISELGEKFPYELSGGELKRASLVRAVLMSPDILIADEPTTGLDKVTGDRILNFLREYADGKRSVLVATHDEHIKDYADKIVTIERSLR